MQRSKQDYNIVLLSLDTLRADHLGCYGYKRPTSPNIDTFAQNHIIFDQNISCSCWTIPSHMSIFSGLFPTGAGFTRKFRPEFGLNYYSNVKTIGQYLKKAGYKTAAFHESGYMSPRFGLDKGFDIYTESRINAAVTFPRAIDFIKQNKNQRLFLLIHTYEAHRPYTRKHFITEEIKKGSNPKELAISKYDSCIYFLDNEIGKFFRFLENEGLMDKTVVIITSDHGENFNYNFNGKPGHHGYSLFDCEIHVPLIIGGAEEFRLGKRIHEQTSSVSILSTICDIAGVKSEPGIRSRSLMPVIDGEKRNERYAFSEATQILTSEQKSIRTNRYKLIAYYHDNDHSKKKRCDYKLYNMKAKQDDRPNVANDHKNIVIMSKKILDRLLKSININNELMGKFIPSIKYSDEELDNQLRALGYIN
ncbi:MAG: sulfatase [Acidobacteria bacterium]|nr:sulfatase [Acidobacteriota bacterium]